MLQRLLLLLFPLTTLLSLHLFANSVGNLPDRWKDGRTDTLAPFSELRTYCTIDQREHVYQQFNNFKLFQDEKPFTIFTDHSWITVTVRCTDTVNQLSGMLNWLWQHSFFSQTGIVSIKKSKQTAKCINGGWIFVAFISILLQTFKQNISEVYHVDFENLISVLYYFLIVILLHYLKVISVLRYFRTRQILLTSNKN